MMTSHPLVMVHDDIVPLVMVVHGDIPPLVMVHDDIVPLSLIMVVHSDIPPLVMVHDDILPLVMAHGGILSSGHGSR